LAKAEYNAMAAITCKLIWIHSLLASLHLFVKLPMKLFCDNHAASHIVKNHVFHEHTKHMEINCYFIQEHLLSGVLITWYLPSKYQVVDIFTKALDNDRFEFLQPS